MFRKILVPLDGSPFAEAAIPVALTIARDSYGKVELVTAQTLVPSFDAARLEAAGREWSERYLDDIAERIRTANKALVSTAVVVGHHVAPALLERAAEIEADLIVTTSHGRGPFSRFWLGSVTDQLVRHSPVPLLVLRPGAEQVDLAADHSFRRILLPVDGSEPAEAVIAHAHALGKLGGSDLALLRVVETPPEYVSPYLPDEVRANEAFEKLTEEWRCAAEEYVTVLGTRLEAEGIATTSEVLVAKHAAEAIIDYAEDGAYDLIAMTTHGRSGLSRVVLGSVTDKVLRGAEVPLLILRPPDEE